MTYSDITREVPEHIKHKSEWRYVQRNPERRKQTQLTYYEANRERLKRVRRERYARQKAERLAAAAAAAKAAAALAGLHGST